MRIYILLYLLSWSITSFAQQVKFYAETDAQEIVLGSYVDIKFILENEDGQNFKPPPFKDFDIISGPSRSSSMSIINGRVSKSLSYGYSIRSKSIGQFQVGSASIQTSSGQYYTRPISIRVVKAQKQDATQLDDIFIVTECKDTKAYIGQQIELVYKLYTRLDVRSINFSAEPEPEGFFVKNLSTSSEPTRREVVNGLEYATKVIKRVSLFPQQKGLYKIDPIAVNLGIATERSSRGFFFSAQLDPRRVIAEGLNIEVRSLPADAPKSFSGAIGSYTMEAQLAKRSISTDEAIVISMSIAGDGDNKTVAAPIWIESDSFDIYDPNIIEDDVFPRPNKIMHKRTFEYLIVPKQPGKYELSPAFSYYDPDSTSYITIQKRLPLINVIQGTRRSTDNYDKRKGLDFTLDKNTKLRKKKHKIFGSMWHTALLIVFFLTAIALFVLSIFKNKNRHLKEKAHRTKMARQVALERLSHIKNLLEKPTQSGFFEDLSRTIKLYIDEKYNIPALHLKKETLYNSLSQNISDEDTSKRFIMLLEECEKALYAPGIGLSSEKLYDSTLELFTNLES